MVRDDFIKRVLTSDTISKFSHYEFDMEKLIVYPKHVNIPNNEDERKGILVVDSIENPFKVNISIIVDVQ